MPQTASTIAAERCKTLEVESKAALMEGIRETQNGLLCAQQLSAHIGLKPLAFYIGLDNIYSLANIVNRLKWHRVYLQFEQEGLLPPKQRPSQNVFKYLEF